MIPILIALASFNGCQPAPGWENMTQLRLENVVEHIRLAREFHVKGYLSKPDKIEIETTLGKYIVCRS